MPREPAEAAPVPELIAATEQALPQQANALARARAFAEPLIAGETLDTGENTLAHADAVAAILKSMGGSEAMQAASYLVYACQHLNKPQEVIAKAFGENYAALAWRPPSWCACSSRRVGAQAPAHLVDDPRAQTENVRKMLLAFSRDLRVVMLRLASRLQTLRWYAASKHRWRRRAWRASRCSVFAPLANRLGIWQVKWEMEDLAFRFLEPETYKQVARLLDEKRVEREDYVEQLRSAAGSASSRRRASRRQVQGRPKHIYSIVKKMRGKSLDFEQVFDVRALRVIVPDVKRLLCGAGLGARSASRRSSRSSTTTSPGPSPTATSRCTRWCATQAGRADRDPDPHPGHARPRRARRGRALGLQGGGQQGLRRRFGQRRLRRQDRGAAPAAGLGARPVARLRAQGLFEDRIYVLTPDAAIVELPQGATPVDFAYSVHTSLGHRCRGARVDGVMVPLNTPLQNGQTVEITAAKEGGPSRDWLNADLGFLASHRARAKVRAWFNEQIRHETVARGREAVEKLLQREGKTAVKLDDLASQLGFKSAEDLFEVVGKDEFSLRNIETLLRPPEAPLAPDDSCC